LIHIKIYSKRKGTLEERTFETMIEAQTTLVKHGFMPLPDNDKVWEHELWLARVEERRNHGH